MGALALVTAVIASLLAVVASQPTCNGAGYDPTSYVCPNNKLCAKTDPCECPSRSGYDCYHTSGAGARSCAAGGLLSPAGAPTADNSGGVCAIGSSADPLVQGFDGCSWYMKGIPGTVVNLITEANHVVNTQLVPANLTDDHHDNDGTFHGAVSMRYNNVVVIATVNPEGNLTVTLGDEPVPFEAVRKQNGVTVKPSQYMPYYGQVVEVSTSAFKFFLHAVQPQITPSGWSRGHLDFSATMMSGVRAHGLLGQTIPRVGSTCPNHFDFAGEGTEEDYAVSDLNAVNFEYNHFAGQFASRRLHMLEVVYEPLVPSLIAFSHGFF